jgi:hypothetical protein
MNTYQNLPSTARSVFGRIGRAVTGNALTSRQLDIVLEAAVGAFRGDDPAAVISFVQRLILARGLASTFVEDDLDVTVVATSYPFEGESALRVLICLTRRQELGRAPYVLTLEFRGGGMVHCLNLPKWPAAHTEGDIRGWFDRAKEGV